MTKFDRDAVCLARKDRAEMAILLVRHGTAIHLSKMAGDTILTIREAQILQRGLTRLIRDAKAASDGFDPAQEGEPT